MKTIRDVSPGSAVLLASLDDDAGVVSIIAGVPAKQIGERDSARANRKNAWLYHRNAEATQRGDHRAWSGPEYDRWLQKLTKALETDADLTGLR